MYHASHPEPGRYRTLASAALLLALSLLVGGAQAVTEPMDMAALFPGEVGIDRGTAADTAFTDSPIAIPNAAADGEPFQVPADPAHVWVAGDVFSLHGVDLYRYIVVYTRDTADGLIHGCYEVDHADSGRYEVSQYVHGQEVFGDTFIDEQGGRFLENVPLGEVVITDDTPGNDGQSYFDMTLGSIFGGANAPSPTETPEPIPTVAHWPTLAPTHATQAPTSAPTGVVSVTRTPGMEPAPPSDAPPIPMPTVTPAAVQTIVTEPSLVEPTGTPGFVPGATPVLVPGAAPFIEPTPDPAVTSTPSRVWGKRFATWQAPSTAGRRVSAGATPAATVMSGSRTPRSVASSIRIYPPWSSFARSTIGTA